MLSESLIGALSIKSILKTVKKMLKKERIEQKAIEAELRQQILHNL